MDRYMVTMKIDLKAGPIYLKLKPIYQQLESYSLLVMSTKCKGS